VTLFDKPFNHLPYTQPYRPSDVLAKLLNTYSRRLSYVRVSERGGGVGFKKMYHTKVVCPDGDGADCFGMVAEHVVALTVFGGLEIGCVMVLQSSRLIGVPSTIMCVGVRGACGETVEGVVAEWSRSDTPKLPTIINSHQLSRVKRHVTLNEVELLAEKYLKEKQ